MSISFEKALSNEAATEEEVTSKLTKQAKILKKMKKLATFLKNQNLKIKETVVIYPKKLRTNYFRGDNLASIIAHNAEKVAEMFSEYNLELQTNDDITTFLSL